MKALARCDRNIERRIFHRKSGTWKDSLSLCVHGSRRPTQSGSAPGNGSFNESRRPRTVGPINAPPRETFLLTICGVEPRGCAIL